MMGFAVKDLSVPVVKTTNCVLAPSKIEMPPSPPAQACIRCGMCAQVCPANLLPQQLYWYAKADDVDRLKSHNLFDCIECGACSFVCPSAIPLVQFYRAAKGTIRAQDQAKQKSDRARQRFDQRKERIAKAEAEKEAKRLARKAAAEEAKKQLANKTNTASTPTDAKTDIVAMAVAQAKSPTVDTDAQLRKIHRALSSAQSRLERAQAQLSEATPEQQEKAAAAVKQAELKVAEAQQKLDAFEQGGENTQTEKNTQAVANKLSASPLEVQQKAIATLQTRLASAQQKWQEADAAASPTAGALAAGVEKLQAKLAAAQTEFSTLQQDPAANTKVQQKPEVLDAAAMAIAKAQAKAAEAANQSDEQIRAANIESLKARIKKAQERLTQAQAQAENSEHVATLTQTLEKLKSKLNELEP